MAAEEGQLYTFGSDYWGCIGCDNSLDEEVKLPYRVEFFSDHPVDQLACGECHVVVLTGGHGKEMLPFSDGVAPVGLWGGKRNSTDGKYFL